MKAPRGTKYFLLSVVWLWFVSILAPLFVQEVIDRDNGMYFVALGEAFSIFWAVDALTAYIRERDKPE